MKHKIVLLVLGIMMMLMVSTVYAATYSKKVTRTVNEGGYSCKVFCKGTYYTSGNTRWSRVWGIESQVGLYNAQVVSSTLKVTSDKKMETKGTIAMTRYDYSSASATKVVKFKVSGSKVIEDN